MDISATSNRRVAIASALVLYRAWVATTYLLEGRIQTLLRPEATLARLGYALVVNMLIGIIGAVWVVRVLARSGAIAPRQAGFRSIRHALLAVLIGGGFGFLFYAIQMPPTLDPIVLTNAFAQVLVVSVAEVLVCWAVVGSISESLLRGIGKWASLVVAAIVASSLFGVYHLAHSPPFNTAGLVLFLTAIGLVTSVFFFVSRDVYGTIVFHNVFGMLGVVRTLESAGALASFERPVIPLLITAAVAIAVLVAAHALVLGRSRFLSRSTT